MFITELLLTGYFMFSENPRLAVSEILTPPDSNNHAMFKVT